MHDRAAEAIGAATNARAIATEIIILPNIALCITRVRPRVEKSVQPYHRSINEDPRRISPTRVSFILAWSYFLQHLLEQHFPLPLQQSAAGDAADAVPINAAKVATKRRYFIKSSS